MTRRAIKLITVSREFGAGGGDFAAALGSTLGWPVLDRDLIHRVAERVAIDEKTLAHYDEHPPSLRSRIATVLIMPQPDMLSLPSPTDMPNHDVIAAATTRVIEDAAQSLPLIVVGHGAQCIFSKRPDAFHVRFIAPVASRIARTAERLELDQNAAAATVKRADQDREAYVKRYFHAEWKNPLMYDLQINTQRVSIADAVQLLSCIVAASQRAAESTTHKEA